MTSDRRAVILEAAGRLFAQKGVAGTTVREIADSVGLLSGSLYHYVDSKAAMVEAIIASHLDDLRARLAVVEAEGTDPCERLAALVRESFATIEAHPHSTVIYQNDQEFVRTLPGAGRLLATVAEVKSTWLSVIEAGVAQGVFRADIPPQTLYRLIRDAVWPSVRWFTPVGDYTRERLAVDCTAVVLGGIARRPSVVRRTRRVGAGADGAGHLGHTSPSASTALSMAASRSAGVAVRGRRVNGENTRFAKPASS